MIVCGVRRERGRVALHEPHAIRHAVAFGIFVGELDQFGIDLDAHHALAAGSQGLHQSARLLASIGYAGLVDLSRQVGPGDQSGATAQRLRTLQRADLRQFTMVEKSPMPSYKDKLSAGEIADLVAYLSSLKGAEAK